MDEDQEEMVEGIMQHEARLSPWELRFIDELSRFRTGEQITPAQISKLEEIHFKVCGG